MTKHKSIITAIISFFALACTGQFVYAQFPGPDGRVDARANMEVIRHQHTEDAETKVALILDSYGYNLQDPEVALNHLGLYFRILGDTSGEFNYVDRTEPVMSIGLLLSGDSPLSNNYKLKNEAFNLFTKIYDHSEKETKVAIAFSLGQIASTWNPTPKNLNNSKVLSYLADKIKNENDYSIRHAALLSLASIDNKDVVPILMSLAAELAGKSSSDKGDKYIRFWNWKYSPFQDSQEISRENAADYLKGLVLEGASPEGNIFGAAGDSPILVDMIAALDILNDGKQPSKEMQNFFDSFIGHRNKTARIAVYAVAIKNRWIKSNYQYKKNNRNTVYEEETNEWAKDVIRLYQDVRDSAGKSVSSPVCEVCSNRYTFADSYFAMRKLGNSEYTDSRMGPDGRSLRDPAFFDGCRYAAFDSVMLDIVWDVATAPVGGAIMAKVAKYSIRGAKIIKARSIARKTEKMIVVSGDKQVAVSSALQAYLKSQERMRKLAAGAKKTYSAISNNPLVQAGKEVKDDVEKLQKYTSSYQQYMNGNYTGNFNYTNQGKSQKK